MTTLSGRALWLSFSLVFFVAYVVPHINAQNQCAPFDATLLEHPCQPVNFTFVGNATSTMGSSISQSLNTLFESYENNPPVSFDCLKFYVAFYCSDYYPSCVNSTEGSNTTDAYQDVRACASACHGLIAECTSYLSLLSSNGLTIPSDADCDTTYSTDTQLCTFSLDNADMIFWYGSNTPPPPTTTSTSTTGYPYPTTTGGYYSSSESWDLYPGGTVRGGVLGAGMLVGLLLLVGLLGLFMKRQERR